MPSLWDIEHRLWLEGADAFEESMAIEGIMAFGPTGILVNADIVASLRGAPRWTDVTMSERFEARPTEHVSVLGYRALADRDCASPYEALCTSTYIEADGKWRIIQHQQTPV